MKTIIIYASTHHGNTKKVAEYMAECISADLIDITQNAAPDITSYDVIGFASGVYFHSLHEKIKQYIEHTSFDQKQKVFLIATCGVGYIDYTKGIKKLLNKKNVECLGSFQCRGYDTFGIFGKIGGIAKNHPNQKDFQNAKNFLNHTIGIK